MVIYPRKDICAILHAAAENPPAFSEAGIVSRE